MADTPQPVTLAVRLPFDTQEDLLRRYGQHLSRGGIYLRTRSLKPPGTAVNLEVKLKGGERLLQAVATVAYVTGARGADGVVGMGFRFLVVDAPGRRFLELAAAVMPHARQAEPPVPRNVGPVDFSPDAVSEARSGLLPVDDLPLPAPSQPPALLPSERRGNLTVAALEPSPVTGPAFQPQPAPVREGPIIGIDLGTTNSSAAAVVNGVPMVLAGRGGLKLVPSMVAVSPGGELVAGAQARAHLLSVPRQTAWGFKRFLGMPASSPSVQAVADRMPYQVVSTADGEAAVQLAGRTYSTEVLSALTLLEVKKLAEQRLQCPVSRAVITVPAWYSQRQRELVRQAGLLAGLYVERIVSEPTAAALAYGHGKRLSERLLVYDLGGGTFDASILELHDAVYEVVATTSDPFLGGLDFDAAIVTRLLEELHARTGATVTDRVARQRVLETAERAKIQLTDLVETRLKVPYVALLDGRPVDLEATLTRGELKRLTSGLVDRTLSLCQAVLRERDLRADAINHVLLVGGQSRSPLVQERLGLLFGRRPQSGLNPEEAVALGAGLLAHSLQTQSGVVLIDVLPSTIGVGLPGGKLHPVLPRGVALPATRTQRLATTRDGQQELRLSVYQGEGGSSSQANFLGTFTVGGLKAGPKGSQAVLLTFRVDTESMLQVTAVDEASARPLPSRYEEATARPSRGLADWDEPVTPVDGTLPPLSPPGLTPRRT